MCTPNQFMRMGLDVKIILKNDVCNDNYVDYALKYCNIVVSVLIISLFVN